MLISAVRQVASEEKMNVSTCHIPVPSYLRLAA
jgi:hypothetical protein